MLVVVGRCPKCKQITDDFDGRIKKVKRINNVYKTSNLLCDKCGEMGEGVVFTFFVRPYDTKALRNIVRQYEKLYKKFSEENANGSLKHRK